MTGVVFRDDRGQLGELTLPFDATRLTMAITVPDLLNTSQAQLDELFSQSPPGDIPDGEAKGTAIVAPGTTYSAEIAEFINHFAWQGKSLIRRREFQD